MEEITPAYGPETATPTGGPSVYVSSVSFIPEHYEAMRKEADEKHGGNMSALIRYTWITHRQRRNIEELAREGVKAAIIDILKDPKFCRVIVDTIQATIEEAK